MTDIHAGHMSHHGFYPCTNDHGNQEKRNVLTKSLCLSQMVDGNQEKSGALCQGQMVEWYCRNQEKSDALHHQSLFSVMVEKRASWTEGLMNENCSTRKRIV